MNEKTVTFRRFWVAMQAEKVASPASLSSRVRWTEAATRGPVAPTKTVISVVKKPSTENCHLPKRWPCGLGPQVSHKMKRPTVRLMAFALEPLVGADQ